MENVEFKKTTYNLQGKQCYNSNITMQLQKNYLLLFESLFLMLWVMHSCTLALVHYSNCPVCYCRKGTCSIPLALANAMI